ncbi:hypothetical protein BDY21DRAFT_106299 [Lineolata rhizophorae]|uniref:Uncharacterized protein n=1 Tax=Lineolata rhizophorae TaxID=578093 RepID=A0A6A6NSE5_9PEZI|nr:hypothetical protein BDY21DRAFT_106299 [Lineolata rhizophorae]
MDDAINIATSSDIEKLQAQIDGLLVKVSKLEAKSAIQDGFKAKTNSLPTTALGPGSFGLISYDTVASKSPEELAKMKEDIVELMAHLTNTRHSEYESWRPMVECFSKRYGLGLNFELDMSGKWEGVTFSESWDFAGTKALPFVDRMDYLWKSSASFANRHHEHSRVTYMWWVYSIRQLAVALGVGKVKDKQE